MKKHIAVMTALAFAGAVFSVTTVAAETNRDGNHPRRAEVNARLANQNQRIRNEVKEGEMSKGRATRLHREDRQVRLEERAMASQNGGRITKSEQQVLNQQENKISQQIGK